MGRSSAPGFGMIGASLPEGALSDVPPDPKQLSDLISAGTGQRPLDPNGIDVPAEIPVMQRAYAKTANGQSFGGKGEAGYSIFKSGDGVGHRGFSYGSELKMRVPVDTFSTAIVHTHPRGGEPEPSPGDLQSKLPNYVFSGNQLYVTDPKTKKYAKYDIDKWNLPGIPSRSK